MSTLRILTFLSRTRRIRSTRTRVDCAA
jgi:hypothetical protein